MAISGGGSFGPSSSVTGGILGGLTGGGLTPKGGVPVGTSRSSQVNALNKLQADANQLQDLVDQLMGVQKVDSMAYGSFRLGEAKSMMTVNFNGIVGDGESVKRNLVELMNDSTARGTLGAGAFNYATDR
jgi:hypothetical protein